MKWKSVVLLYTSLEEITKTVSVNSKHSNIFVNIKLFCTVKCKYCMFYINSIIILLSKYGVDNG